jgi:serine/threonine-protein kinase
MGDPLPGYRILELLGTGARSKIHAAVELKTGTRFAVKHVVRANSDDDRFFEQMETEYHISSQLDHPHLRRCYHLYRIRKLLQVREMYLVMELIDGLSLDRARPNRLNTFLVLFQKVAAGLQALHESGYVHTDLKPINIMLARKGIVKIIDFGQSCRIGFRKARIQGTPDYIAPEQVRRMPIDVRTDVFNLGATMYWVLTSRNYPTELRGHDFRPGIHLAGSDRPIAPIELNAKIPISLSNMVMECCRENPAERPADMKQIMARLKVIQKLWRTHREELRLRRQRAAADAPTDASRSSKERA